jgi:ADP-dependent NAD(P)H-hydrate dehydratase / NAD(P)H-hydrate epimerase
MKVLTSAEMREVDRLTGELGIPGPILMENAGHRVVEYIAARWPLLSKHRVVVLGGKGNNGGDGFVIARQLFTRFRTLSLHVAATDVDAESEPLRMLRACGCPVYDTITQEMRSATLLVDALLGTGLQGPARGKALDWIREINTGFPHAKVVAVDVPSGMNSDSGVSEGDVARADVCVTFTALKVCHVLAPNCDQTGEVIVGHIGSRASLLSEVRLHMTEPADFAHLLKPRAPESNKGDYGHVLVVGGAEGKTGAAGMAGLAALRVGAGLTTVASTAAKFDYPELMTAPLPASWAELEAITHRKRVVALGPGLGTEPWARELVRDTVRECKLPLVLDADGLNALAGSEWEPGPGFRVLTPHPGEMSRLLNRSIKEVQQERLTAARDYAAKCGATVVLKGNRTVIALPDGRIWINPTGSPALAKGGTGDVLTGLIAGMLAQWPDDRDAAVLAAVYLHGLAGQRAARDTFESTVLATDLLKYLPEAMRECARVPNRV